MNHLLEQLYASPEVEEAFEQGKRAERRRHECKTEVLVKYKKRVITRAEHPRSRWLKYEVVSNGKLLNPTFNTEAEAGMFIAGLVPANEAARAKVNIDAVVVALF